MYFARLMIISIFLNTSQSCTYPDPCQTSKDKLSDWNKPHARDSKGRLNMAGLTPLELHSRVPTSDKSLREWQQKKKNLQFSFILSFRSYWKDEVRNEGAKNSVRLFDDVHLPLFTAEKKEGCSFSPIIPTTDRHTRAELKEKVIIVSFSQSRRRFAIHTERSPLFCVLRIKGEKWTSFWPTLYCAEKKAKCFYFWGNCFRNFFVNSRTLEWTVEIRTQLRHGWKDLQRAL